MIRQDVHVQTAERNLIKKQLTLKLEFINDIEEEKILMTAQSSILDGVSWMYRFWGK